MVWLEWHPTVGSVPASSLIFVVIVAIWAVYLLQHWSRRRENAAAARSVDGFTEAMRVLEKRRLLPSAELAAPRPHSYSVTPARVVRSTVDVKRAVPAGASRRSSPLVARRRSESDHAEVETMTPAPAGSDSRRGASTDPRSDTRPSARPSRSAPRRPPRPVSRTRRRLRAALLLLSLLWVPTSVVLVVLRILLWMSVPLSVLTVVVVLVWLRTEAQADRARVGDTGRRPARHPLPAEPAPVLSSDDTQVIREPHRLKREPAASTAAEPRHSPCSSGRVSASQPSGIRHRVRRPGRRARGDHGTAPAERARHVEPGAGPQADLCDEGQG